MKKNKGPLVLFIVIVIIALVAYFGKSVLFVKKQADTSDSQKNTESLKWAGDGYLGYAFLQTVEMKKQLARKGLSLNFTDDGGNYEQRLEKFAEGEYDFIVLPVNSYIEHGLKHKFPGVIVAAICESKGADAIVGFPDVLPNNKINDLDNNDLIIYYTGKSPSSFLLDLTINDFDLGNLQNDNSWRRELGGSEEVYKKAKEASKDRTVGDAFVMWEPDVSRAINKLGMKKLWGSDKFSGYIIDVFVFHRDVVAKKPEQIDTFLKTYFRVLNYYESRNDEMIDQLAKISKLDDAEVKTMIENIEWFNLAENCMNMFDLPMVVGMYSNDGIINSIYACSDIMRRTNVISQDIDDPFLLINSSFIETLKSTENATGNSPGAPKTFDVLTPGEWKALTEIGTMRVEPVTFQSGTSQLDYQGEEIVDKVALMLVNNYPDYRVAIRGHTGKGDEKANLKLSSERADIVRSRLIAVHGVDPNRLLSEGLGDKQAPIQKTGENIRAFSLRWARVEFVLLQ
jgi:outer membrane protein OmpA-like peptidoglycan-associated protein